MIPRDIKQQLNHGQTSRGKGKGVRSDSILNVVIR